MKTNTETKTIYHTFRTIALVSEPCLACEKKMIAGMSHHRCSPARRCGVGGLIEQAAFPLKLQHRHTCEAHFSGVPVPKRICSSRPEPFMYGKRLVVWFVNLPASQTHSITSFQFSLMKGFTLFLFRGPFLTFWYSPSLPISQAVGLMPTDGKAQLNAYVEFSDRPSYQ